MLFPFLKFQRLQDILRPGLSINEKVAFLTRCYPAKVQESCGRPIAITCVGQALTLETSGLVNPYPREEICLKVFVHINEYRMEKMNW